uniref:Uncharacterized protein n=1 Tax=Arion vulgaris TaxID=1028688 RepID=A0A0B6ZLE7_9EUPU
MEFALDQTNVCVMQDTQVTSVVLSACLLVPMMESVRDITCASVHQVGLEDSATFLCVDSDVKMAGSVLDQMPVSARMDLQGLVA